MSRATFTYPRVEELTTEAERLAWIDQTLDQVVDTLQRMPDRGGEQASEITDFLVVRLRNLMGFPV
jgi:hypothetical protein